MKISELNSLISDLVSLRNKAEIALSSKIQGVELSKDQTDILKNDCALLQKKVIVGFETLSQDVFQIELDSVDVQENPVEPIDNK